MTVRTVVTFEEASKVEQGKTSDTFLVNPNRQCLVVAKRLGADASQATIEVSVDDIEKILADAAVFVQATSGRESAFVSMPKPITAVRLAAKTGDWLFQVRQS